MDARRRWTVGAALGLAVACIGGVWLSFQDPAGQIQRLPGGATLELRGTTYGKHHRWHDGSVGQRAGRWWRKFAPTLGLRLPPVPSAVNGAGPGAGPTFSASSPAVDDRETDTPTAQPVLWFRIRNRAGQQPFRERLELATRDSHGCRVRCDVLGQPSVLWLSERDAATSPLFSVPVPVFPRRESSFRLQLTDEASKRRSAEFFIVNPSAPARQVWEAPRCPVQARSGNLRVVLQGLTHVTDDSGSRCKAIFEYEEDGKPTQNWQPVRVEVQDATGNTLLTDNSYWMHGDPEVFDALCRFETAWKLRVRLMRADPASAPAERTWHVRLPAFPRRNAWVPIKSSLAGQGYSVQGVRISGGGTIHFAGGGEFIDWPTATFRGVASDPVRQVSLIRVTGPRGHEYAVPTGASQLLSSPGDYQLELPAIPPGTPVDLTFAIHQTRAVEFLVKP